tara:strand:+ start:53192 stop:53698 length:507 start_codon:yes stop_codon:yes gene_type:complete
MNTRASKPVHSTLPLRVLFLVGIQVFGFEVTGFQCVAIEGGATELSWSIRTFDGDPVNTCASALVDKIRLCWNALDSGATGCRPGNFREFKCEDQTGVTLFEIEPGRTAFFAEPICADGQPATVGTYQSPPEIVRTVRDGEVVSLESLLIVVTDHPSSCGVECTCVRE